MNCSEYPTCGKEAGGFFYNREVLAACGLDYDNNPPATLDQFLKDLDTIKAAGYLPIYATDNGWSHSFLCCFAAWWPQVSGSARVASNGNGTTKFADDQGFLDMMDMLAKLYADGMINQDYASATDDTAECPIYYNHPNNGRPNWTTEVKHIGYSSDYVDCATLPLYSFGHGLSYSNFVYKDLMLSDDLLNEQNTIQVSVTLRNESDYVGKEVVQLYMHDLYCSVIQPVQKLIGFQKVELKPWEERQVVFTVKESHLRFWNFEDQYVSEPGEVELMVGHADHFVLTERITLRRQ